ncbi:MAG: alpha-mannosidase [Promethearchaeota archaeon]
MEHEENNQQERRGFYSGSLRIDEKSLEEPEIDDEQTRKRWLEEMINSSEFLNDQRETIFHWKALMAQNCDPSKFDIHIITQSHLDMAWLWRYAQTRRKAIRTLTKVVYHAEKYPQFRYALSSPQLLAWVKEDDPILFAKVKELQKEGKIELVGGSWVEPDCMMPSGEAMIRQRLYGMKFYNEEFHTLPRVEWFLDSFGYNVGLPQILKKSGADYFWTSKLNWNKQTDFPFVYFNWKSPDGTQLLTSNFGQFKEVFENWNKNCYGRHPLIPKSKREWNYQDDYSKLKDHVNLEKVINPIGYFAGKGDGGHGPTHQDVAELLKFPKLAESQGLNAHWSSVEQFFKDVEVFSSDLPIWTDELYLETHRGTFSVHSSVKRHNRRFESLLTATESLATIISTFDSDYTYPYNLMEKTWKMVLLNQFHDVLPGSIIPEVLDDVYELWEQCDKNINIILTDCLSRIQTENGENFIFFNPLSWARTSRVFIPFSETILPSESISLDEMGKPPEIVLVMYSDFGEERIFCQPVAEEFQDDMKNRPAGWWTIIEIPAFGFCNAKLELGTSSSLNVSVQDGSDPKITNDLVSIKLDPKTGAIVELKSPQINQGKNLVHGKENFLIQGYVDRGYDGYPAWNLSKKYWEKPKNYDQTKDLKISILDKGPIFSTLLIKRTLGNSPVKQWIRLFKDDPVIYGGWAADWQEEKTMLKLVLDSTTGANEVSVDQMYCIHHESSLPETPCDKARFEKVMQKFVDVSTRDNSWGVSVINEGKYAFDCSAGRIRLTIHRAVKYPSPCAESWVHQERALRKETEGTKPPKYSGIGKCSARFAILPHNGGVLVDKLQNKQIFVRRTADEFNSPIISHKILENTKNVNYEKLSVPNIQFLIQDNVQIVAVKPNEWQKTKSIIIRLNEISDRKTSVNLFLPSELSNLIQQVIETDLLERPLENQDFLYNSVESELKFEIGAFEIKTFKFLLK